MNFGGMDMKIKKKNLKRIGSILLSLSLVFSLVPGTAFSALAAAEETASGIVEINAGGYYEITSSTVLTDTSGNTVALSDIKKLIISGSTSVSIESGVTFGNSELFIDAADGSAFLNRGTVYCSVFVGNMNNEGEFYCSSASGSTLSNSGKFSVAGNFDVSSFSTFENTGTISASSLSLSASVYTPNSDSIFSVSDKVTIRDYNNSSLSSSSLGRFICEPTTVFNVTTCSFDLSTCGRTESVSPMGLDSEPNECYAYELLSDVGSSIFDTYENGDFVEVSGLKNGIYAKDKITLSPLSGYKIKLQSGDSTYTDSLSVGYDDLYMDNGEGLYFFNADTYFYLLRQSDYAQSSVNQADLCTSPKLKDIVFDSTKPDLSIEATSDGGTIDIEDGSTVIAKTLSVKAIVNDDNLVSELDTSEGAITVAADGSADITFTAPDVGGKDCYITVSDLAGNETTFTFTLKGSAEKATTDATVSVSDIFVGSVPAPKVTTNSDCPVTDYKFTYSVSGENNYSNTVPSAAGSYDVKASIPETDNYKAAECTTSFKINKITDTDAYVSINDTYHPDEDIAPYLSTVSDNILSAKYEYKLADEADDKYTETCSKAIGSYVLRVTVPESATYEEIVLTAEFKIVPYTTDVTASVEDTTYGEKARAYVAHASDATPNFKCKLSSAPDSSYEEISSEPDPEGDKDIYYLDTTTKKPGSYDILIELPETSLYARTTRVCSFEISKKTPGSASVSVGTLSVGDPIKPEITTDSDGKESATFRYKKSTEPEDNYTETEPTAAGYYTIECTIPATDNFEAITCTTEFAIVRKTATATVTVDDLKVGDTISPKIDTNSDCPETDYLVKYAVRGSSDLDTTPPKTAGDYTVYVTIKETDTYEATTCFDDFTISKRIDSTPTLSINDTYYVGDLISPSVTTVSNGVKTIEYKKTSDTSDNYDTAAPAAAGSYDVRATVAETDEYEKIVLNGSFEIIKYTSLASVTVDDIYYGGTLAPHVSTSSDCEQGDYKYIYSEAGKDEFTDTVPTKAGSYVLKVVIPATTKFEAVDCSATFNINKKTDSTATLSINDTYYVGDTISPSVSGFSDGTQTFKYKKTTDSEDKYDTAVPRVAGSYDIRATVAETDEYEKIILNGSFEILKNTPSATVTVADIYVGQTLDPQVTCESTGKKTYKYKLTSESADAYTTTEPTKAGTYDILAIIEETDEYNSVSCESTFEIKKLTATDAVVTVADTYVGEKLEPVVTTLSDGKTSATFEYKQAIQTDDFYVSSEPTAAGSYTVRCTVPATDSYDEQVCTANFSILRYSTSLSFSMPDVYVGDSYDPTEFVDTDSDCNPTEYDFKYSVSGEDAYEHTQPTAAGTYDVYVYVPETEKHASADGIFTFSIKKKTASDSVLNLKDTYYVGEEIIPSVTTESNGNISYASKAASDGDSAYMPSAPTAVGSYTIRAIISETAQYNEIVLTKNIEISLINTDLSVEFDQIFVGDLYNPLDYIKTNSDCSTDNYSIMYAPVGSEDYTTTPPTEVGSYRVSVYIPATERCTEASFYATLIISKHTPVATVTVDDIVEGETVNPQLSTDSNATPTYKYKLTTEGSEALTETVPTKAGTYDIVVTLPETDTYYSTVCESTFTIKEKVEPTNEPTGAPTDAPTDEPTDGPTVTPSLIPSTEPTATPSDKPSDKPSATPTAKPSSSPSKSPSPSPSPTASPTKKPEATPKSDDKDKDKDKDKVTKKEPHATVKVDAEYVGQAIVPELTTNSDGKSEAYFEYKLTDDKDSEFERQAPMREGNYTVRCVIPETDNFEKKTCEAEFSLTFLPAVLIRYSILGKKGNDNYYVSDVMLAAPAGFLISASQYDSFDEAVNYTAELDKVYYRRISDGAITIGTDVVENIKIDKESPSIISATDSKGNNIALTDGAVIYSDELAVKIHDEHLKYIYEGRKPIEINEDTHNLVYELKNREKLITIKAEDAAGNMLKLRVLVKPTWMLDFTIPEGSSIALVIGQKYNLQNGSWKINKEKTIYRGGRHFYVNTSGDYIFSRDKN